MNDQLTLFADNPSEKLFPYWWESLKRWPAEVFMFRHSRDCTGWSMATQDFSFARWLFMNGQMDRSEFRRYWRLNRRVQRWERKPHNS